MTAKSVIASAKRLIDVRHFCWKRSRMAEMSVPAWPMPIHQTKLMMSNAQPTGMLLPQTPMPLHSVYGDRRRRACPSSASAMPKSSHQPLPGLAPDVREQRAR